ncbi:MAG: sporulation integral membrane protein YtvI [Peptoclostridium sp.]|uniref:sporulation integral membrane protein YtvI n=1 Tax=Peptoclostridium sp. TaxID=1904860 RepID=UPI00139DB3CE|nr:sporulation integral membrane protein YtvI [Peptoclostridium sp.]MZQ75355.1 sporulation integral membrane protein YtvI [Peptoclostridium sp.]
MMDKIKNSLKEIFSESFMKNARRFGIFAIFYTIAFIAFFGTAKYTFPFIIAFIIALSLQPLTKLLNEKLKLSNGITALIASLLVYAIFFTILTFISFKVVSEAKQLLSLLTTLNINDVTQLVKDWMSRFDVYFKYIDPDFLNKNSGQITDIVKNIMEMVGKVLNGLLSFAASLPLWIAIMVIVMISTYFFTRDMGTIREKMFGILSDKGQQRFLNVWDEGIKMFARTVKSYALIYFITFLETFIGFFFVLKIKYAVILSVVAFVVDIIPVLGAGAIYWPLIIIYAILGNYKTAIGLMMLYVFVVVVRNVIEPKLVSTSLGIHPVLLLAAIFVGLMTFGASGIIYLILMIVSYKIFNKTKPKPHPQPQIQEDTNI